MKQIIFILLLLTMLTATNEAQTITMTVEGSRQGKFKGESVKAKFTDKIDVTGFIMEATLPKDATGRTTGRRTYEPITILKQTGASSPQFLQALTSNESIRKVTIEFYKTDDRGVLINYYTVILENASVSGFKQFTGPLDNERFNPVNTLLFDEIKFVFGKISISEKTAGIMTEDSL